MANTASKLKERNVMEESMFGHVNEFEWKGTRYIAVNEETPDGCTGCEFASECNKRHGVFVGCTSTRRLDRRNVIWKKTKPSKTKSEKAIQTIESYISCLEQGNEPDFMFDEMVSALKKVVQLAKTNLTPLPTRIN